MLKNSALSSVKAFFGDQHRFSKFFSLARCFGWPSTQVGFVLGSPPLWLPDPTATQVVGGVVVSHGLGGFHRWASRWVIDLLTWRSDCYELVVREFKGKSIVPKRDPSGLSPGKKWTKKQRFFCEAVKWSNPLTSHNVTCEETCGPWVSRNCRIRILASVWGSWCCDKVVISFGMNKPATSCIM